MTARHLESINKPISIDADFFDRLDALITFAREKVHQLIADENSVSIERVKALKAGEPVDDPSLDDISVRGDIRSRDRLTIRLIYAGTKEISADSIADCIRILKEEFGVCEIVKVDFGSYGMVSLDIDLDGKYRKCSYDIRAERIFADALQIRTRELLTESAPAHAILHAGRMNSILPIAAALSASWLYFWLIFRFRSHLPLTPEQLVPLVSIPFFGVLVSLADPIMAQYRKTFPFLQVEFGTQKKRRDASKTATNFLLGVLILPIALSLLGF